MKNLGHKQKLILYGLTVFLSSAFLLVLEITAGRLLAPYIGVSLYTWTSIIGVILAGLSLGNWIGGVWADAGGKEKAVGITLVLGAISCFLILLILQSFSPVIQKSELNLLTASFVYVLLLFFMPSLFLGVITPLLTTMALSLDSRTGHIVGRMHALAALGSIVGTFVTGYWLVQYVGTRNIILGTAVALLLLSVPFLLVMQRKLALFLLSIGFVSGAIPFLSGANISPCDRESNYYCIRIVDQSDSVPYGQARAMILDHLLHGINHETEDWLLVTSYTHLMDELILRHFGQRAHDGLSFFFAGGGSYSQPRATRALYKDVRITVAELDLAVTEMAERKMYYKRRGAIIKHRDARLVLLDAAPGSFDVVVGDVFHDISIPYHLLTREYVQLVKSRLSANGFYTLNVIDAWPDALLAKSILKTLRSEFRYVDIWADRIPIRPTRMTYVISATDKSEMPDKVSSKRGIQRTWKRLTNRIIPNEQALVNVPMLTDDYVPVERLIAPLLLTKMGR